MILTTPVATPTVEIQMADRTVIEPGSRLYVKLQIVARQPCTITGLEWNLPKMLRLDPESEPMELPMPLDEGQELAVAVIFFADERTEGFGEIEAALHLRAADSEAKVAWAVWISVFKRAVAREEDDTGGLSDPLRDRLLGVVNAVRTTDDPHRNGHIFLADPVAFFDDYLNIAIPDNLAMVLLERFALPTQGIPVSKDVYQDMALGVKNFYGMVRLELIPEEECEESDDRFDPEDAREVGSYEINL